MSKPKEQKPEDNKGRVRVGNLTQPGGGMDVESEPGKGTTFLVSFPVNDEQ